MLGKIDVGLLWAKFIAIWGQISIVIGFIQFWSTMIILYTVTISPAFHMPVWAYIAGIAFFGMVALGFVLKWGISGYYRFFNQQSELSKVRRDLELIKAKMGIIDGN